MGVEHFRGGWSRTCADPVAVDAMNEDDAVETIYSVSVYWKNCEETSARILNIGLTVFGLIQRLPEPTLVRLLDTLTALSLYWLATAFGIYHLLNLKV